MAGTKEIKGRIQSVRETGKIPNAMYLIASTKMRKAREELANTRPYFEALRGEIKRVFRTANGVESRYFYPTDVTTPREGTYGCLVVTADKGLAGAYNQNVLKEAQRLLDVNFFGMVRMNKAVIPHMRQAGRGRIVNLSSVAAPCPIPFQAYYSAGKAAVNAYTMALANELRPFGITVCAVQPGDIHTGFTAARVKTMAGDDVYQGRIGRSVQRMEHDEQTGMDPAKAGAFIARVAMKRRPKPIYTIRLDYQFFVFLTRILPGRTLNWLIGLLYAR